MKPVHRLEETDVTLPGEAVLNTIQEHGVEDWRTPPRIGHEKPPDAQAASA